MFWPNVTQGQLWTGVTWSSPGSGAGLVALGPPGASQLGAAGGLPVLSALGCDHWRSFRPP